MPFNQDHMLPDKCKNKGITIHKGWKMIYKPTHPHAWKNGYIYEHRLIMEVILQRYLDRDEFVHHIDENKLNNDPLNLQLVSKSEHRAIHNTLDKKGITLYDVNEVKKLYLKGYSCRDIAKLLGIGKSTVASYIKQLGISRPQMTLRDNKGKFTKKGIG